MRNQSHILFGNISAVPILQAEITNSRPVSPSFPPSPLSRRLFPRGSTQDGPGSLKQSVIIELKRAHVNVIHARTCTRTLVHVWTYVSIFQFLLKLFFWLLSRRCMKNNNIYVCKGRRTLYSLTASFPSPQAVEPPMLNR